MYFIYYFFYRKCLFTKRFWWLRWIISWDAFEENRINKCTLLSSYRKRANQPTWRACKNSTKGMKINR